MTHRYRGGYVPAAAENLPGALGAACRQAPGLIDAALAQFDFRRATPALWAIVDEANRHINRIRPWELAKAQRDGDIVGGQRLDTVLATLICVCRLLAGQLAPFLPDAAARITRQCTTAAGPLPSPSPVLRKISTAEGRPRPAVVPGAAVSLARPR
jgi:methionyl-tRNA synthetase